MFKTAYARPEQRYFIPSGEHLEKEYGYNKKGELEETGLVNVYEKIQECAEDTKIINILKRVTAGDTTMLRPDGIYEDVSEFPKDFNSQMEMMRNAKQTLDEMATQPQQESQPEAPQPEAPQAETQKGDSAE